MKDKIHPTLDMPVYRVVYSTLFSPWAEEAVKGLKDWGIRPIVSRGSRAIDTDPFVEHNYNVMVPEDELDRAKAIMKRL